MILSLPKPAPLSTARRSSYVRSESAPEPSVRGAVPRRPRRAAPSSFRHLGHRHAAAPLVAHERKSRWWGAGSAASPASRARRALSAAAGRLAAGWRSRDRRCSGRAYKRVAPAACSPGRRANAFSLVYKPRALRRAAFARPVTATQTRRRCRLFPQLHAIIPRPPASSDKSSSFSKHLGGRSRRMGGSARRSSRVDAWGKRARARRARRHPRALRPRSPPFAERDGARRAARSVGRAPRSRRPPASRARSLASITSPARPRASASARIGQRAVGDARGCRRCSGLLRRSPGHHSSTEAAVPSAAPAAARWRRRRARSARRGCRRRSVTERSRCASDASAAEPAPPSPVPGGSSKDLTPTQKWRSARGSPSASRARRLGRAAKNYSATWRRRRWRSRPARARRTGARRSARGCARARRSEGVGAFFVYDVFSPNPNPNPLSRPSRLYRGRTPRLPILSPAARTR